MNRKTWALLILLLLVNVLNFIDRQLPFILAEAIRRDLQLSDTELGLMGGATFAVFYAFVSLPMANLADRGSARWTLAGCIAVWSAMTALGGLAQNFTQIALSRMGVAIGEAGCTPCSHSLIAKSVPVQRRALAIGIFAAGTPVGIMIGMVLGGWLADVGSWRNAFILVGLPGLILAALVAMIGPGAPQQTKERPTTSMTSSARTLFRSRSYAYLVAALTSFGIAGYAGFAFGASYFIRIHHLTHTEAGFLFGLLTGGTGVLGALTGGLVETWLGKRDRRYALFVVAALFAVAAPLSVLAWLAGSPAMAVALLVIPAIANIFHVGPCYAMVQALAPSSCRAAATAIPLFGQALIGASTGPLLVGAISDALRADFGDDALRYGLCVASLGYLLTAWLLVRAAAHVRADLSRIEAEG